MGFCGILWDSVFEAIPLSPPPPISLSLSMKISYGLVSPPPPTTKLGHLAIKGIYEGIPKGCLKEICNLCELFPISLTLGELSSRE